MNGRLGLTPASENFFKKLGAILMKPNFTLENRHIRRLKKLGWTWDGPANRNLKSWLRAFRAAGERFNQKR